MDRTTLRAFLAAGPTRKFDLRASYFRFKDACLEGGEPEASRFLFHSSALNKAVLFKYLKTDDLDEQESPIRTLIYLPYEPRRPEEGGQSFFFNADKIIEHWREGSDQIPLTRDVDKLHEDINILNIFDKAPTFNPFLVHDAFEQAGYDIAPEYLNVDQHHAALVKQRIKNRIRPLIIAALSGEEQGLSRSLDTFASSIWDNRDPSKIRPLIAALALPEENAGEIIHCWCGITYFEQEFVSLEKELRGFAEWLSKNKRPREVMPDEALALIDAASDKARGRFRKTWLGAVKTLQAYQTTFEQFIGSDRNISPFVNFMGGARGHFWTLGAALGKLEQSIYAWRAFAKGYKNGALPYERLSGFYQILNQTH